MTALQLQLESELRRDVERVVCQRIISAVQSAQDRDEQLQRWSDQLEGVYSVGGFFNKRWPNSSDCTDPIIRENHLEILGAGMQTLLQDPLCQVEASDPEDENNARLQEQWFAVKRHEVGFNRALYNLWYNACRDPAAVCFCPWKQIIRQKRVTMYRASDDTTVIHDYEKEEGIDYTEVMGLEPSIEWEGIDPKSVDLADFYVYPADEQNPQAALGCGHRMFVTSEWLLDSIDDYDLDKDAVFELLNRGSGSQVYGDTIKQRQDERDGLSPSDDQRDGLYEIFMWYGRLPHLVENDDQKRSRIPKWLRQDDMEYIVSPMHNIILRMDFSQYPGRPYFPGGILPNPNRLQGSSIPQLLDSIQAEANANENYWFDSLDLTSSPVLLAKKEHAAEFGKWQIYPGAIIPVNSPDDVTPLRWDRSSQDLVVKQQFLETRGKELISGRSNQLQPKVRKSGEIQAAQQAMSVKIDLYLHNFQESILNPLFAWWVSVTLQHMSDDGEDFLFEGDRKHISPQQLRGKYQYRARGTSQMATTESRVQIAEFRKKVQVDYFQQKGMLPPDTHALLWHAARELLLDVDTRYPEAWIGEEPEKVDPQQAQMMAMAQQGQQGQPPMMGQPPVGNGNGQQHGQLAGQSPVGAGRTQ